VIENLNVRGWMGRRARLLAGRSMNALSSEVGGQYRREYVTIVNAW
jgi:hypothetical protein